YLKPKRNTGPDLQLSVTLLENDLHTFSFLLKKHNVMLSNQSLDG
ncbi:hypothetical protein M5D96_005591, partial [Drosophila gunungcola]